VTAATDSISGVRRAGSVRARVNARDGVVDTMRGLAILMVIGIHSLPRIEGSALVTAIDALLRPSVPVFLFASGYLTAQSGQVPLLKRVRRTLAPYTIAFVAAYIFMNVNNPHMDNRLVALVARYVLAYVFVYYYVFVYIGCTVLLWAAFRAAGNEKERGRQRLMVLLAGAIVIGLTFGAYIDPLLQHRGVSNSLVEEVRMRDVPFWFAFAAVGAIVGALQVQPVLRDMRYWLAAAAVAGYAAYTLIRIYGIGDAADYDSIAFFLYAALFSITMLGFSYDSRALAFLGSASYFIYLWHIFIVMILRQVPALQGHAVMSFAVEFLAAAACSIAAAAAIRRFAAPRLVQWLGA
jgi:peptidoglycan/LPS O-acetylase OafA/YrhL